MTERAKIQKDGRIRLGTGCGDDRTALVGVRVMVVDDEEEVGRVVGCLLLGLGCVPMVFDRPEAAVSELLREPTGVDVVLSDVHMPGMTGWELLQAVRSGAGAHPPIILSSGCSVMPPELCHHRPNAVLPKPYRVPDLRAALGAVLSQTKGGRAAAQPRPRQESPARAVGRRAEEDSTRVAEPLGW